MWLSLVTSVKADIQSLKADEKILGEVPDEFECPLLCTIMEDPVKLPSGKNIIFFVLLLFHQPDLILFIFFLFFFSFYFFAFFAFFAFYSFRYYC